MRRRARDDFSVSLATETSWVFVSLGNLSKNVSLGKLPKHFTNMTTIIKSAGIIPIYHGKVYFLKDKRGKLCDFGGKREGQESPEQTAWRESREEGGFDKTNCIKVLGLKCSIAASYSIRVCEINKLPVAKEQNTSVVTMDYDVAWRTKQLHFRVASTLGLKQLFGDYKNSKRKRDEPVRPMFLDHVGPDMVRYKQSRNSAIEMEVKIDPVEITIPIDTKARTKAKLQKKKNDLLKEIAEVNAQLEKENRRLL